jgi:DNA helicase-2/ATP-dependent DNA helicase PcrA
MNSLGELNAEQLKVVTHENGPQLVVAGAGTGKTKAIAFRVAWLIENDRAKPDEILALTFTEKAAKEMEERTDRLLPYGCFDMWIMTFHGFADRILRQHGIDIGLPVNYKLLDETGQWLLVRKNLDKFNLDYYRPMGNPIKFIHALLKHFSRCKDELIFPEDYLKYAEERRLNADVADFDKIENLRMNEVANAYHVYQKLLLENNALDFGDLINYLFKLFRDRPNVLKFYRDKFKYVLVDEFQDTNYAQYEMIKMLVAPKNNLTVLSDDDQSIYAFRGSSMSNILRFKDDFPSANIVTLIQNYRTIQPILDKAYDFIQQNNPDRLEAKLNISKKLKANMAVDGVPLAGEIFHFHGATLDDEARFVSDKISQLKTADSTLNWSDFAILVRANDSADIFNSYLSAAQIPFQFVALRGLYQKPLILDVINFFRLLDNYHESTALYRVMTAPFVGVKEDDVANITYAAKKKGVSLFTALKHIRALDVSEDAMNKIDSLLSLIDRHSWLAKNRPASEVLLKFLYDSKYIDLLQKLPEPENQEQLNLLQQFFEKIKAFEAESDDKKLAAFMESLEMELEAGESGKLNGELEAFDSVKVMTIHGAKGLEFQYVFIVNMVDQRFPTIERHDPIEIPDALVKDILPEGDFHLQEERRLFYVAMTRAKKGLYFTSAENYGGVRKKKISRFLVELGYPENCVPKSLIAAGVFDVKGVETRHGASLQAPRKKSGWVSTYYSFSQLNVFNQCPRMYKFSYILKIVPFGKPALSFGNSIHNTLHVFLEECRQRAQKKTMDLFSSPDVGRAPIADNAAELLPLVKLIEIYKQQWIDEWYPNQTARDEFFEKGKDILVRFYKTFEKERPQLHCLENSFKLGLDKYTIVGKIDRIDEVAGGVEIIDYKTGSPKDKLDADSKRQLLLYQMAAEDLLHLRPSKLTYYYLEEGDAEKQRLSFIGSDEEKSEFKSELLANIKKIEESDFAATPGFACQYCDYRNICEHKKT